jgi:hypothetical protein
VRREVAARDAAVERDARDRLGDDVRETAPTTEADVSRAASLRLGPLIDR